MIFKATLRLNWIFSLSHKTVKSGNGKEANQLHYKNNPMRVIRAG